MVSGSVSIDAKIFILLWKIYAKNFIGSYHLLKYVHFHDNGFKHYSFLATEGEHDVARIKRAFGSSAPPCNSK